MARTKRKVNPLLPVSEPASTALEQRIYRVGGYARLSVEDSGKAGSDTMETQIELIQSYIAAQPDMQLAGMFSDNGKTGTNFERPAFEKLMNEVRAGQIDCIVVKDLSRFGRNYLKTGNYLERIFPFLDVRFVAITDHFDTLTAERSSDGYIIPLKNMINAAYSKDISHKVQTALMTRQQKGEFTGSWAPYGYRKCAEDHHRLEPDEETAPIVRQIFQWRLSGMGYLQIMRKLQEQGIPSPARYHYLKGDTQIGRYAHAKWYMTTIQKMLANEVYLGHMIQGRQRSGFQQGTKRQFLSKSEWIVVPHTHQAIVDEETFQAVQQLTEQRHATRQSRLGCYDYLGTTPNVLLGLLCCADCKRSLIRRKVVKNEKEHGKKRYYIYICPTNAADLSACPRKYIHETEVKELIWETLQKEIALVNDTEAWIQKYQFCKRVTTEQDVLNQESAAAKQALNRAKMLYDSLYQNYVEHLMSEREYQQLKQQYRADQEQAQARLDAVEQKRQMFCQQTIQNPWLTTFGQFKEATELTEEMAHALIERVEIDANRHVSIFLRYQSEYRTLMQYLNEYAAEEGISL